MKLWIFLCRSFMGWV